MAIHIHLPKKTSNFSPKRYSGLHKAADALFGSLDTCKARALKDFPAAKFVLREDGKSFTVVVNGGRFVGSIRFQPKSSKDAPRYVYENMVKEG